MNIHERIIARLMEARSGFYWCNKCGHTGYSGPQHGTCGYNAIKLAVGAFTEALIDMAIDDVRRECQRCDDDGFNVVHKQGYSQQERCFCNRPTYLEECERRLNGQRNSS